VVGYFHAALESRYWKNPTKLLPARQMLPLGVNPRVARLKNEPPIERQILGYLKANPTAQDTLRGIIEWWLLKQRIREAKSYIEKALASLVAKGKLTSRTGADGQVRYRLRERQLGKRGNKF